MGGGCWSGSCSVNQEELDSAFPTCYKNCLQDGECAAKSGKLDNLSSQQIKNNIDLIIASGHTANLIEKGFGDLLAEKDSTQKPEVPEETDFVNGTLECGAEKFEEDLKILQEDVKIQEETIQSLGNDLSSLVEVHDSELKSLKQELAALKSKLEDHTNKTANLKIKIEIEIHTKNNQKLD